MTNLTELYYLAEQEWKKCYKEAEDLRNLADEAADEAERRDMLDDGDGYDEQVGLYEAYIEDAHALECDRDNWEEVAEAARRLKEALAGLNLELKVEWA